MSYFLEDKFRGKKREKEERKKEEETTSVSGQSVQDLLFTTGSQAETPRRPLERRVLTALSGGGGRWPRAPLTSIGTVALVLPWRIRVLTRLCACGGNMHAQCCLLAKTPGPTVEAPLLLQSHCPPPLSLCPSPTPPTADALFELLVQGNAPG